MSGGSLILVWVAVLAGFGWFLIVRPQRRARQAASALQRSLTEGDEIATIGGIYGRLVRLEDDEARIEIADGVVIRVARRAIAGRVGPPAETSYVDDEADEAPAE
jgi:preprotein translocase subunit YajC